MNSYTILNQTFYGIRLFDSPDDFDLLKPFFYEYVNVPCESITNPVKIESVSLCATALPAPAATLPLSVRPSTKWFDPKQHDTLFWCIFTAAFGVSEYILIGTKYANREWEEKQTAIVAFQKSSASLRATNHKITLGKVQEIMSEYMTNQSSITLLGVVGLSVHYKIQIYLIDSVKKTHLVYTPENYVETCYIYRHSTLKNKFRLALETVSLDDSFCLESFTRPLRAVSTYKMGELEDLAKRFGLYTSEKLKKDVIYRKISEHVFWL
jgi:hypothetical protein